MPKAKDKQSTTTAELLQPELRHTAVQTTGNKHSFARSLGTVQLSSSGEVDQDHQEQGIAQLLTGRCGLSCC